MSSLLLLLLLLARGDAFDKKSVRECAENLGERLLETFNRATAADSILKAYAAFSDVEQFDPRLELKRAKAAIEEYLSRRAKFAWDAKLSLEARELRNVSEAETNSPDSKDFVRFMSAKRGSDIVTVYPDDHSGKFTTIEATRVFNFTPNANFYHLNTSSMASAVHVPTPVYARNGEVLNKIEWSDIDQVYRANREHTRDLAFQLFCSESGFMRYFPAASWMWDSDKDKLDLFDCRNTEWYINGATCSKNVLIMLDMSGSMLGQRYEIAKQTTEAILDTLSHNDFFNIMQFSKEPHFMEECGERYGLLQATMRNKKALRAKMTNGSSEGKADYEKGLGKAFETLLGLPGHVEWHSKEEMATLPPNITEGKETYIAHDYALVMDQEYFGAIKNSTRRQDFGCENVIMLITDGAPENYEKTFRLYNSDKKVRFFSFLIGEEAIDFEQVKWMACNNRGFMVHVANMADVEEKVQHYIRVMSRPIGARGELITEKEAQWSGVYRERLYLPRPLVFAAAMPVKNTSLAILNKEARKKKIQVLKQEARSRMFVTTVSYPVIVNDTFMGVAAVNIPLTELMQLAHPSNVGAQSYFFMVDHNGFIMFHPQLRPIDSDKNTKQNYNSMELLELEVAQTSQMRRLVLDCDNSDTQELDILFATDLVDRVYPQTNKFYAECIDDSHFILGLAIAAEDDFRVKRKEDIDYAHVQLSWMDTPNWAVHPHWRYCLLNDSDSSLSKEEAFLIYAREMRATGKLPELCRPRRQLVDKLLFDLKVTQSLESKWEQEYEHLRKNLINVVFFGAPSGMIRYYNTSLDMFEYKDPNWETTVLSDLMLNVENAQQVYSHFIKENNRKVSEDRYFRRSVRMRDTIVFDINNISALWYPEETLSAYGNPENVSLLATATKALFLDKALVGVTGYEFAYDALVTTMEAHGCGPSDDRRWCLLLDEHAYVVYSNQRDVSYADMYRQRKLTVLFNWLGEINRVAQRAMQLLIHNGYFSRFRFVDHQAICKDVPATTAAGSLQQPFRSLLRLFMRFVEATLRLASSFSLLPASLVRPAIAYTASFHDGSEGFPCSKESFFYLANRGPNQRPIKSSSLVEGGLSDRPCKQSSAKCSVKMNAWFVPNTNLLMLWILQDPSSANCYDDTQCPLVPGDVPFGFAPVNPNGTRVDEADDDEQCRHARSHRSSKKKEQCFDSSLDDESTQPCSGRAGVVLLLVWLLSVVGWQ